MTSVFNRRHIWRYNVGFRSKTAVKRFNGGSFGTAVKTKFILKKIVLHSATRAVLVTPPGPFSATTTTMTTSTILVDFLVHVASLLLWFLILVENRRDGLVSKGADPHFLQLLLDVGVPVVLDLIISSPREVSCNLKPPTCKETN